VIHVFGVTHAGAEIPEGLSGLGDPARPVRLVAHDDLAAVVCDLDAKPKTRQDLDRHQHIQGELVQRITLVPLRFGTLMEDEDELVSGLLGTHAAQLRDVIAGVEGRVQLTVKAIYGEGVLLREVVKADPKLKQATERMQASGDRDGLVQLGQRIAGAVEERRVADEAAIVRRLEPHAEHIVVETPGHEREAARLQILVPRDKRDKLDRAVAELATEQEARMVVRYIGPLAPYTFCDLSLDAEAAWG